jgi:tRNA A-37 threonylcarbamoyl transferase component Bud32
MSGFIDWPGGPVRWRVQADLCTRDAAGLHCPLFGPDGLRLAAWLESGQARVVKQGQHRTVYHVALPGLDFHLKHYPLADTRAWLRQLVRPSKARTEHERTLAVAARGVPTLEPLAVGECGSGARASYLITRTLPDAVPLNTFLEVTLPALPPARQAHLRQRLAEELGRFVARMHHEGITHHDLHPGNLLLQIAWDSPRLYLIDLHAVRFGAGLDWADSRANLVIFNRWFILRAERADRLRFWLAYQEARRRLAGRGQSKLPNFFEAARDLEVRTVASNLAFWHHHDGRCLGSNRYFRRVHSPAVRGHAVADLDPALVEALLLDPDEPFRRPGVVMLKDSRSSAVVELQASGPDGPRRLIYKRFNLTTWTDPWTALVRPTPALRSYCMGHALRWRGLPTARPLAVLHRRRGGLPGEGYLLTEKLPDARHLLDYLAELDRLDARQRRAALRRLIDQLARLVADLHQRRLAHRDLKAPNLLVSSAPWRVAHPDRQEPGPARPDAGPHLWLIDLVGVACPGKLSRALRVKNLTRLHASFHAHPGVTRTDKLRFLRVYLRRGLRGKAGWKRWWREIEKATEAKVRRNLRRGRPLY